MKFHCFMLDRMLGWDGVSPQQGLLVNGLIESQIIDKYALSVEECLDNTGIPWEETGSRKKPGASSEARYKAMSDGKLGVRFGIGTDSEKNTTRVIYSHKELEPLAKKLNTICFGWAWKLNPTQIDGGAQLLENQSLPPHIILEPFTILSPSAFKMSSELHMTELGKQLGLAMGKWLKEQNPHTGFRPRQLFERQWLKS